MPDPAPILFRSNRLQTQNADPAAVKFDSMVSTTVQATGIFIQEPTGRTHFIDFNQVLSIQPGNYRLEIRLQDQSVWLFSELGYDYEPFLYQVFSAWNAFVSQAMFIDEPCLIEVKGEYDYQAPAQPLLNQAALHESDQKGDTRFRLYDSSLMILPVRGSVRRIPLCFVEDIRRENWQIILRTDIGEQIRLIRLGYDTESILKAIHEAVQRQTGRAFALLRQVTGMLDPGSLGNSIKPVDEQHLMAAAWYMREGRAVNWQVLDQVCPGLTDRLDLLLRQWSKDGYYQFLTKLAADSGTGGIAMGIRREQGTDTLQDGEKDQEAETAHPDAAADDKPEIPAFWLAVPLPGKPAATAIEVIAGQPLAQATYCFERDPNPALWPQYLQLLNHGLEAVDFRRQPVYFPMEKLSQPVYQRDLSALRFCPPLLFLRKTYLRRLIHRDFASWQAGLNIAE